MSSRLIVALLGLFLFLHGGEGASFEEIVLAKIESTIEEAMTPFRMVKSSAELEVGSRKRDQIVELETKKQEVIRELKGLPQECASGYLQQVSAIDDNCQDLTKSLESLHQSVLKGYGMSSDMWRDIAQVGKGVVKCPNLNPIIFARCLIETMKDVRDKINTYKPKLRPFEEEVKTELVNIGHEITACLNYKKNHADAKLKEAVEKCKK